MAARDLESVRRRPTGWLTLIGIVVTVLWIGGLLTYVILLEDGETEGFKALFSRAPNEIGDFLAGAFAPLAFLWLVLAVLLQRMELSLQREELARSTAALRLQADELHSAVEQYSKQAAALTNQQKYARIQAALATETYYVDRIGYVIDEVMQTARLYGTGERDQLRNAFSQGTKMIWIVVFLNKFHSDANHTGITNAFRATLSAPGIRSGNLVTAIAKFADTVFEYREKISDLGVLDFPPEIDELVSAMNEICADFAELAELVAGAEPETTGPA